MKQQRQKAILNIISANAVETQEDLLSLLEKQGFMTTQATVSRDIRELGLDKVPYSGNRKKYVAKIKGNHAVDSYMQVLSTSIVSMECAENIIVVKTVPGMAMAAGAAIDALRLDGVVGCIAGDDTIFVAIKHSNMAEKLMGDLKNVTKYAH